VRALRAVQPLVVALVLIAVTLGLTAAARELSAGAGFLVERPVVVLVWLAGLLVSAAIFVITARWSLRRADSWLSLWPLAVTAIILGTPLLLGLLQHPAP
jgi:hypothetical protein